MTLTMTAPTFVADDFLPTKVFFKRERRLSSDLKTALIALVLIFVATPIFADTLVAQTSAGATAAPTTGTGTAGATTSAGQTAYIPLSPANSTGNNGLTAPTTTTSPTTSVNVQPYSITPGSSQSLRSANAQQNGTNLSAPQPQNITPCTVGDSVCLEQQSRMSPTTPYTTAPVAPGVVR